MTSPLLWFIATGPLALAIAGYVAGRAASSAVVATGLAIAAAATSLAVAVGTAISLAFIGPVRTGTLGWQGIGVGLYLDALSAVTFVLVAFVGLIVVRYSRNYLHGDPGQARFTRWLCLTLAAVLLLIVAGNLLQLWLAWIATSIGLNRLLLFFPQRQAAVLAARKKFVASRLGDACVLAAMLLIYRAIGSLDYAAIFSAAGTWRTVGAEPGGLRRQQRCSSSRPSSSRRRSRSTAG